MSWGIVAGAAASVVGGALSSSGSKKAANAAAQGSADEIAYNRETRDLARQDQEPYREAGYKALDALMSMTGLGGVSSAAPTDSNATMAADRMEDWGNNKNLFHSLRSIADHPSRRSSYQAKADGGPIHSGVKYNVSEVGPENVYSGGAIRRYPRPVTIDGQTGYVEPHIEGRAEGGFTKMTPDFGWGGPPRMTSGQTNQTQYTPPQENPGGVEGGYNFMTDPGYEFRTGEGMRALDRSAAARGGLLSGGFARKAIRYGQDYASGEYTNVYNRIANIAGLGQTANQSTVNAALYTGANMGNAAANAGYARASGYAASGNAWANTIDQIAQLPWDQIGKKKPAGGGGGGPAGGWS